MDISFTSSVINCRYMELVKLKAVKDKVTFTLTRDVKIVLQADRVSFRKLFLLTVSFSVFRLFLKAVLCVVC